MEHVTISFEFLREHLLYLVGLYNQEYKGRETTVALKDDDEFVVQEDRKLGHKALITFYPPYGPDCVTVLDNRDQVKVLGDRIKKEVSQVNTQYNP